MLELSPFYLQQGRENMAEWTRLRDPASRHPSSFFVQAAAEKMPAQDNTYDAVSQLQLRCSAVLQLTAVRVRAAPAAVLQVSGMAGCVPVSS